MTTLRDHGPGRIALREGGDPASRRSPPDSRSRPRPDHERATRTGREKGHRHPRHFADTALLAGCSSVLVRRHAKPKVTGGIADTWRLARAYGTEGHGRRKGRAHA